VSGWPASVAALLAEHHAGGVGAAACRRCPAACCAEPGFALLENAELIYARHYRRGRLRRAGYAFAPGLSLGEFVLRHFDLTTWVVSRRPRRELALVHPRVLAADGELLVVPEVGEYWETRARLLAANRWLGRGCVFLDRPLDGSPGSPRRCLLHSASSARTLGAKPIDCVFFTCSAPLVARYPDERTSERWLRALADAYPGSAPRLRALLGE
jgi:hypothetical protein